MKQPIVNLSFTETEYVASTSTSCQTMWTRITLSELQHEQEEPNQIFCDNKSAIALSRNHVFHKRSKHIETSYHFIRELMNKNEISVEFCRSKEQFADLFTKSLRKELIEFC